MVSARRPRLQLGTDERAGDHGYCPQTWEIAGADHTPLGPSERRGCYPRSLNSNGGRNATSPIPWINFPLMSRAGEIENAVMILHGEKAHSFYFGSDAYKKLTVIPGKENNKLFMVIPGASHTDLYDQKDKIPFAEIEKFFNEYIGK